MHTPGFWQTINIISILLWPLSLIYRFAALIRRLLIKPKKINTAIICIGNITAGGSGKTPICLAIGKILQEAKIDFAYLGHSYKAELTETTLVNKKHNASQVGDEALLLNQIAPTFIGKNRSIAAQEISQQHKKQAIIMDDGLQNPSIIKDFAILVIDGEYGFGNNLIIPAGPLREKLNERLAEIKLIIITGKNKIDYNKKFPDKKVIFTQHQLIEKKGLKNKNLIAFCGIGRPVKFFNILKENGYNLQDQISFPDHHQYQDHEIEKLIDLGKKTNCSLVTTKKDFVRLKKKYHKNIQFFDIEVKFNQKDQNYLKNTLKKLIDEN